MNYHDIKHCNMVNGDGLRTVIWVSGCSHNCVGCFNKETHDVNSGIEFDEKAKLELFRDLSFDWCSGVTFTGGDPLFYKSREEIISLCKEIKENFPQKTIWLYTGYCWDDILNEQSMVSILKYVDVVCDGQYIESLKSSRLKWVGSSNQRVINVKDRIKQISSLHHI